MVTRQVKTNKKNSENKPQFRQWRFWLVVGVVISVFTGLAARAAYIQVIDPDQLVKQGDNRTLRVRHSAAHRGMIMDRNGVELAVSIPVQAIYADPKIVHDKEGLQQTKRWQALAEVLGQDYEKLIDKVSNPQRRFVYIQRQVSTAMADYVKQLKIPGIYLREESRRYYPTGEVSAHVVGFTGVDDDGLEGIEKLYNEYLTSTPDKRVIRRDRVGRQVELLDEEKGKQAQDITLTLDQRVQAMVYRELKEAVQYLKATSGSIVVTDVHTGEILAMVNSPSFNPNNRSNVSSHRIRNRAATDAFEPGSSVKPLAVLSALEFGVAELDTVIDTAPGRMRIGGSFVSDPRNYGELDLTGIIQKSSNMGTSKLALQVPKEHLLDTYYAMGLIGDTGTQLLGESEGIFNEARRWSKFELATLSFGYGLSVTSLQLARMYSTLGNGGVKLPLSIVKRAEPAEGERVISQQYAKAIINMMESVTQEGGTATKAAVAGYRVAGKTGTSQKAVPGGYGEEYVNIFAGVAPASDPQIAVVVLINEPGGDLYHSGDTAAPVFSKVMAGALQMLNVAPDARGVSSLAKTSNSVGGAGR
ncbi:peptidoglycan glycosyltransferase FtsI [Alteromonadaceae bacterium M269]|nr:peptidoglycan glycosyltransferase FtsI [Alteromonadaceae bacterium M269]